MFDNCHKPGVVGGDDEDDVWQLFLKPGVVGGDDEDDAHGIQNDEAGQDVVFEQGIMLLKIYTGFLWPRTKDTVNHIIAFTYHWLHDFIYR